MSLKLKVLGLGLLAVMATSAFASMNASAKVSGHFTHAGATTNAIIKGEENKLTSHFLHFQGPSGKPITCEKATYEGTVTERTVQVIQVFPTYTNCATKEELTGTVKVTTNGCSYTFFSQGANAHGTVSIDCPEGKAIEIHHENCTITVGAQTPTATRLTGGINYTTTVEPVHALTADVTVSNIDSQYHGGVCIFLGTSQKFTMTGSVTVKGFDHPGGQIAITST
jgi:hypothetical protein